MSGLKTITTEPVAESSSLLDVSFAETWIARRISRSPALMILMSNAGRGTTLLWVVNVAHSVLPLTLRSSTPACRSSV